MKMESWELRRIKHTNNVVGLFEWEYILLVANIYPKQAMKEMGEK